MTQAHSQLCIVQRDLQGDAYDPFPLPWTSRVASDGDAADDNSSLEELESEQEQTDMDAPL
jgi:hypothetical protein